MAQTSNRRNQPALTRFDFLKIAAHAETDPRTIAAYMLEPEPSTRRAVAKTIRQALAELGYQDPHATE